MRALWIVALLIGCGGGKARREPPAGTATKAQVTNAKARPSAEFEVEMVASTSGLSMEAIVRERKHEEPLGGATIVLTSPALQGSQTNITDETGRVTLSDLPPGDYTLMAYYLEATASVKFSVVKGQVAKISLDWDTTADQGEVVAIEAEEPKFDTAIAALRRGAMGQAVRLGQAELAKKPTTQLHGAMAIARYAFATESLRLDAFAMGGQKKTSKDFRNGVVAFLEELDKVQDHLAAAAKDGRFTLELCVACMADDGGYFHLFGARAFDIERDKSGQGLPENDKRRKPTYRFDHGDLAWGRAFVHFNQAVGNILLAYDWSWVDKFIEDDDTSDPDTQVPKKVVIKLVEPARIAKAREHVLAGLRASDEARLAFLSETDDDREWVPSPKQKSYASPLAVDAKLYATWKQIVEDVRVLVDGKAGISLKALWAVFGSDRDAPAGFVDVAAMLNKPSDIVFELGMIDRVENEKNAKKRAQLTQTLLKGILGNGLKTTMKPSPLTDRLIQLRKGAAGAELEDKLKYLLWLN